MNADRNRDVLMVTQYYWPEPIGSAPYCRDIAEWLAAAGWNVQVLTARPHYPEGFVPPEYRNGARDSESRGGVAIERLAPWQPHRRGTLGRIFGEAVFFARGALALLTRRVRRSRLVISLCPSVLAVLLGQIACRRGGHHFAVVHDIQSGLASGLKMSGGSWLPNLIRRLERSVLNLTDCIFVLSEQMRAQLQEIGVRTRIETLPIWVDADAIHPIARMAEKESVTALYSGNLGRKQALDQLIGLAEDLERRGSDIRVVIRGQGNDAERLQELARTRNLRNLHFSPLVPAERLAEGLAEGDIHLVPQNSKASDYAVPSKIYGIMAAGRTFVATAEPGSHLWEMQRITGAFRCVPPDDPGALAEAVLALERDVPEREALGRRGREFVMAHHAKAVVLGTLGDALSEAADIGPDGRVPG